MTISVKHGVKAPRAPLKSSLTNLHRLDCVLVTACQVLGNAAASCQLELSEMHSR